jgi:hypothetical protein
MRKIFHVFKKKRNICFKKFKQIISKSGTGNMASSKGNVLFDWNHSGNNSDERQTQLHGSIDPK